MTTDQILQTIMIALGCIQLFFFFLWMKLMGKWQSDQDKVIQWLTREIHKTK